MKEANAKNINKGMISVMMILLSLFFSPQESCSQYVEILAELDTNMITIGDQFRLNLSINQPAGMDVIFPVIRDTVMKEIEVLQEFKTDTTLLDKNQLELKKSYLLTCFDSGLYEIPPLPFRLSFDNWTDTVFSNPMYLLVFTVPLDSTIRDIKTPVAVPVSFTEILPYLLIGVGILALAYFVIYYLRKRKRKEPVFAFTRPQDPPHVIALRELDELREAKLWQRNEFKVYYTRLTEIIRTYIERRFAIPAMEQTTYDILQSWKEAGMYDPELNDMLKQLLNLADLVKFAKEKPLPTDNEINMDNAYVFVKKTRPVVIIPEDAEKEKVIPEKSVVNG
ncbi:MAG: hypothetical protein AMS27_17300 [Bacteroides sp. SM23_62_1]|nr:MAG: hypothetical protein AMS27_17300 [Bacteroides sp. SM23_62_1]